MKILMLVLHWGHVRHFDGVLRRLAAEGHTVHIAAEIEESFGNEELVRGMAEEVPGITYGWTPDRRGWLWRGFARELRHAISYLRFFQPRFEKASTLREMMARRTIPWFVGGVERLGSGGGRAARILARLLRAAESAIPIDARLVAFVRDQNPDLVVVTPLAGLTKSQFDELRAVQKLGLRSELWVWSWDNLSKMSEIRCVPDRILVWNQTQKQEALRFHGVPEERVVVTGAQGFDRWFNKTPETGRDEFCLRMGLAPENPFILYLCSGLVHGSPSETGFVLDWLAALRRSDDPRLRNAGVLIRPHPQRMHQWEGVALGEFGNVVLRGRNPVNTAASNEYYDSMYHCGVAVGLSSTAMIEAAILGKAVHTVLAPQWRPNQEGLLHFHYLLSAEGGLLHVGRNVETHLKLLAGALEHQGPDPKSQRFVRGFVRPHGIDVPATDLFVTAVGDHLAASPPRRARVKAQDVAFRALLYPLVLAGAAARTTRDGIAWLDHRAVIVIRRLRMRWHRGKKSFQRGLRPWRRRVFRVLAGIRDVLRLWAANLGRARRRTGMRLHRGRKHLENWMARVKKSNRKRVKRARKLAVALYRRVRTLRSSNE